MSLLSASITLLVLAFWAPFLRWGAHRQLARSTTAITPRPAWRFRSGPGELVRIRSPRGSR